MTGRWRPACLVTDLATWTLGVTSVAVLTVSWGWLIWGADLLSPTAVVVAVGVFIVVNVAVCRTGKLDNPPTVDDERVATEPVIDDQELKHFMSRDWDKPLRKEVPR